MLAIAGVIVAAALKDSSTESSSAAPKEQVRIEVRSMPVASLRVDGKKVGDTPMVLQFAKSNREIVIEATMDPHVYDMRTRQRVSTPITLRRTVVLDRDLVVDFTQPKKE